MAISECKRNCWWTTASVGPSGRPRRMAFLPKLDGMDSADEDPSSAYQTTHTGTTAANSSLLQVPVVMSGS